MVATALVIGLERLIPAIEAWREGRLRTDLAHLFVSQLLVIEGVQIGLYALAALLPSTPWMASWPLAAEVALALVIGELGNYWAHRLGHRVPLIWRFHRIHHTPIRLYWLNGSRFHPLDSVLQYTLQLGPIVLLGAGAEVVLLVLLITNLHGLMQHANVTQRLGGWHWIFSSADLHRWHHALGSDSNFGVVLSVWDTLFGTRYLPRTPDVPNELGVENTPKESYLAHLKAPFYRASSGVQPPNSASNI